MKKFLFRRITERHGFTLVELLVVIAIIAVLGAVTMGIGTTVLNMAKRTRAQNTASQIQTAALSYYTEYSVYPTPSGSSITTDYELTDTDGAVGGAPTKSWGPLIECLSGNISPSSPGTPPAASGYSSINTRAIAFLSLKGTDVGNGGTTGNLDAPLNPLPPASGNKYFNIAFDTDYDGILGGTSEPTSGNTMPNFTTTTIGTAPPTTGSSTAGIAVWANCNSSPSTINSNWYVHTY